MTAPPPSHISRYGESGAQAAGRPKGSAMTVEFELAGQKFLGLNGGPHFKFSEAISFMVNCESQQEIDEFWAAERVMAALLTMQKLDLAVLQRAFDGVEAAPAGGRPAPVGGAGTR